MDYGFYTANQTPYQFMEYGQDANGSHQNGHTNGFGTTSPQTNNPFQAPYEALDHSNIYDPSSVDIVPPPIDQHRLSLHSLHQSPDPSISPPEPMPQNGPRASFSESNNNSHNDILSHAALGDPDNMLDKAQSSSEEKDPMTPAQTKRKAQNRAAQRAFRERKERHVKDLEVKLDEMEQALSALKRENEQQKREIAKLSTENQILIATSQIRNPPVAGPAPPVRRDDDQMVKTGPMVYEPTDNPRLKTNGVDNHTIENNSISTVSTTAATVTTLPSTDKEITTSPLSPTTIATATATTTTVVPAKNVHTEHINFKLPSAHRVSISPTTGERLLSTGAVWEFIQNHPLYQDGLVEIEDVHERLQGTAVCDGMGPAFAESVVEKAIEDSVEAGDLEEDDGRLEMVKVRDQLADVQQQGIKAQQAEGYVLVNGTGNAGRVGLKKGVLGEVGNVDADMDGMKLD